MHTTISEAAELIRNAKHCIAFTGAGISVESGIPPFRGENGLWDKYDPSILDLNVYLNSPAKVWPVIRELFYDFFTYAKPNAAHIALAQLEEKGFLKAVVTQNIDNLHHDAGNKTVFEFHGNSRQFVCTKNSSHIFPADEVDFNVDYPHCPKCSSLLKPDFIFFGEGIPPYAFEMSQKHASMADVVIVVGSTGEVVPASYIPHTAKSYGAKIIEVNPSKSTFTHSITDIHIEMPAGEALHEIVNLLG